MRSTELIDAVAVVSFPAVGGEVAPAVGSAAVSVRDAVGVGKLPGADDRAGPALGVVGERERGHASCDVGGRFRDPEAGTLAASVAPVRLGYAEVLQHLLGAQPAGRDADGGHRLLLEF